MDDRTENLLILGGTFLILGGILLLVRRPLSAYNERHRNWRPFRRSTRPQRNPRDPLPPRQLHHVTAGGFAVGAGGLSAFVCALTRIIW